ncbi:Trp biosynthesis-associated membrane protein [Yonghaparkia sp. Soil809]|uniref:Trp biosynthesis-associated membrane protein n=1 Tax=Yonghaparkia sp. Soil809 TaxID=1736417 RepID=UPI0006FE50ED|nr:Trp biosynthesis-associated membrane protein [Yonghaparkia sp. Soil809]KRF31298.1 hypothetical protein ASG83_10940 [Yonghaparkia sp. Soil809]
MTPRRVRALALLAPLVVAALTLLAWTQPWVDAVLDGDRSVTAAGDVAAPALPALALAALALVAALALSGPVFRVVLGILLALLSSAILTSAAIALGDPVGAASAAVTELSGVDGEESVRAIVEAAVLTVWPPVALLAGIVGILAGVGVAATARRWPDRVRKYDAVRASPAEDPASEGRADRLDAWDALSDGRDPTAG